MGTVLVVGEDPLAHYADTLLAYFMAEAVACGQASAAGTPAARCVRLPLSRTPPLPSPGIHSKRPAGGHPLAVADPTPQPSGAFVGKEA